MVFLKEFFEKVDFEKKKSADDKNMQAKSEYKIVTFIHLFFHKSLRQKSWIGSDAITNAYAILHFVVLYFRQKRIRRCDCH